MQPVVQGNLSSASRAVNFHGAFKAATLNITSQKLGIPKGTVIFVRRVRLEALSSAPDIVNVALSDFTTSGSDTQLGPVSANHLCNSESKFILNFSNPNSRLFWEIENDTTPILQIRTTDATATLTFAGTVWIDVQGTSSENVSPSTA